MKVREINVSKSDQISAEIFFNALTAYYDVSCVAALDMFARTGVLTVKNYVHDVASVDLWELGPEHRDALMAFAPRRLRIGCSYRSLEIEDEKFGLVVVDSPQGIHSDYTGATRVEHFDVMQKIGKILDDRAVIVLYCNHRPYNKDDEGSAGYDEYEEYNFSDWMEWRETFYAVDGCPQDVPLVDMLASYENVLSDQDFAIESVLAVPCFSDVDGRESYATRVALEVVRIP